MANRNAVLVFITGNAKMHSTHAICGQHTNDTISRGGILGTLYARSIAPILDLVVALFALCACILVGQQVAFVTFVAPTV